MADGGVSQHALQVVFEDRDEGGKHHRDQARGGHDGHEQVGAADDRRQARQQKNTGLDHGGRVQVGGHWRGRGHGLRQPEVKRKLRTFGKTTDQDQHQSGRVAAVRLNLRSLVQHLADLVRARDLPQQHQPAQHRQATAASDGQRHARARAGVFAVLPVAHQQKRRDAGQLPEHHQQQHVV